MAKKLLPALAALLLLALSLGTALAHESREDEVEGFFFVVGFLVEPAYEGFLNGVSLRVTKPAEEDAHDHSAHDHGEDAQEEVSEDDHHAEPVPVEGLEQTLLVEVTHIPTGASRVMPLHAEFDKPGYYKANFIPTASGQYAFHFKGSIEGVPIDERFESGPGRFDDVQPATDLQFPVSAASTRELESAVRGALESAQQAQDAALRIEAAAQDAQDGVARATTMAMVGIAVGAVGIVVGAVGVFAALRRRG